MSLPDRNLAAAVREALGLGRNARITDRAIQHLRELDARKSEIKNLTGLEHATRLRLLELRENQLSDITPLANLKSLKELILDVNRVSDITPLTNMTQLHWLLIGSNPISDFTALKYLSQLVGLSIWNSNFSDTTLLINKTKLTHLWLSGNNIRDITPLVNLVNLKVLDLRDNSIRDISPLAELTKLKDLKLGGNPIADKSPLRILKDRNPELKVDIEVPPLSPIVHVSASQRPPLYWISTAAGTLHRLVSDTVENLELNVKNATGLAVDAVGGKLYWTERTSDSTGRIRRANLDGTNVKLVKNLTSVPYGIAIDTVNGKLYLMNAWGKVQRLNVDGSNFQPNLITSLDTPRNLVVDVASGKKFLTIQWLQPHHHLERR